MSVEYANRQTDKRTHRKHYECGLQGGVDDDSLINTPEQRRSHVAPPLIRKMYW